VTDRDLKIEITNQLDRIDREEWDELCENRPFADHRWLHLTETTRPDLKPHYLQIRRRGRLEAGAVCAAQRQLDLSAYLSNRLLLTAAGRFLTQFPPLSCELFLSRQSGLLVRPGCDADRLIPPLLKAMSDLAARERASLVGLFNLSANDAAWRTLRQARCHSVRLLPDTCLPISWPTFEDYLNNFPSKKRRELRRMRRRASEAGVTVETLAPSPATEPLLRQLVSNVLRRHGQRDPYAPDLFSRAAKALEKDFTLLVARQEKELVACLALLRSKNDLLLKWAGLDYDRTWNTFTYHLLATESISHAIEMGVRCLWLGATAYQIKKLMGGIQEDRFLALAAQPRPLHRLIGLALTLSGKRAAPPPSH
jgi:predicted N-acyltransferase